MNEYYKFPSYCNNWMTPFIQTDRIYVLEDMKPNIKTHKIFHTGDFLILKPGIHKKTPKTWKHKAQKEK